MTEDIHISASQIKLKRACKRAYGFAYVEGLRAPTSPKQQFGLDVHDQLEHWLRDARTPDDSAPGEVAKQGLHLLPAPSKELQVEHKFDMVWRTSIELTGVVDCASRAQSLVIDHKTTSNIYKWAMTVEQLTVDPQALLYAVWAMITWGVKEITVRWVYYSATSPPKGKRKPNGSKLIETTFHADDPMFLARVDKLEEDIADMVRIRQVGLKGKNLPPSPGSCNAYGGCWYRKTGVCVLDDDDRLDAYFT